MDHAFSYYVLEKPELSATTEQMRWFEANRYKELGPHLGAETALSMDARSHKPCVRHNELFRVKFDDALWRGARPPERAGMLLVAQFAAPRYWVGTELRTYSAAYVAWSKFRADFFGLLPYTVSRIPNVKGYKHAVLGAWLWVRWDKHDDPFGADPTNFGASFMLDERRAFFFPPTPKGKASKKVTPSPKAAKDKKNPAPPTVRKLDERTRQKALKAIEEKRERQRALQAALDAEDAAMRSGKGWVKRDDRPLMPEEAYETPVKTKKNRKASR